MRLRRDEIVPLLAAHRNELARLGVSSLGLFGSAARDEAGPGSDVDLLVEFEGAATFDQYAELLNYLEELLGCAVDLRTPRSLPPFLRHVIEGDLRYVPGLSAISR